MATLSESHAVKSLNKGDGNKRFVFKTFSQRLKEVDIDVFHSLDIVKPVPSEGSFFLECLVQWRELNLAKDFMSFYDLIMPKVQTLPLVILHKELIVAELLSRLTMEARLSLEPLLRLLAALSRDILADFVPFLPLIVKSFFSILECGADKEPEIIEQIFTSWSHIIMYLRKYLVGDIIAILKVAALLRYYPKEYIQEFMAEALSFLLRNAPVEQLAQGTGEILCEVMENPSPITKFAASSLFSHSMRGTSLKFHSKALRVLRMLLDRSTFDICKRTSKGFEILIEVLIATFQKLCEEWQVEELEFLWICLREQIGNLLDDSCSSHLCCLLSVLVATVRSDKHHRMFDHKQLLALVNLLREKFFESPEFCWSENTCKIFDKVLQLMLYVLHGFHSSNDVGTLKSIFLQWASIFQLKSESFPAFIEELLQGEASLLYIFRPNIICVLHGLIEDSQQDAVYLMLRFFQKLEIRSFVSFVGSESIVSEICHFLHKAVLDWVGVINKIREGSSLVPQFNEDKLSLLWGIIRCYRYMPASNANKMLLMDFIDAVSRLSMDNTENIAGVSRSQWQSIIGAAVSSYSDLSGSDDSKFEEAAKFLHLAKENKLSWHVLHAVADFLDSLKRFPGWLPVDEVGKSDIVGFVPGKIMGVMYEFGGNLCHCNKHIRVSTLRILIHCERFGGKHFSTSYSAEKNAETDTFEDVHAGRHCCNVFELLHEVETTSLSVSTSRKVTGLLSQIQMALTGERVPKAYLGIVLNSIIGIIHNRFSFIWSSTAECLAILLDKYPVDVWDGFMHFIENCQFLFLSSEINYCPQDTKPQVESSGLLKLFRQFAYCADDSTPTATILSTLLQSLHKISGMDERPRPNILSLFLKFLGYGEKLSSVGSFKLTCCRVKEWRVILKEWLNLLKLMNLRSSHCYHFLKDVFEHRLLDENDPETQMKVLDCLATWKSDYLNPYIQHLRNLIKSESLREELALWNLSRESSFISECHRPQIVNLVMLILIPKIRKMKKIGSHKASVLCRKAMLSVVAQLDVEELTYFFVLLIKPLHVVSGEPYEETCFFGGYPKTSDIIGLLKYFGPGNNSNLPWKKISGLLHVLNDILAVFDEFHMKPFLDFILGCVVRVLRCCTSSIENENCGGHFTMGSDQIVASNDGSKTHTLFIGKKSKGLRTLCLKIISFVINKYEDHDFCHDFWELFFLSVKPLVENLKQEGTGNKRPSYLLCCFTAMARNYNLLSILVVEESIIPAIFSILSTQTSEAVICCVLTFIVDLLVTDAEIGIEDKPTKPILASHVESLVHNLHNLFLNYTIQRKIIRRLGGTVLRIFKMLVRYVENQSLANKFAETLVHFLRVKSADSGFFLEVSRIIGVISPLLTEKIKEKVLAAVSPFLAVAGVDARESICDLLDSFSQSDPDILSLAKLIRKLNATSADEVGELDYDTILNAYTYINVEFFSSVRPDLAKILLSHFIYHLSSADSTLRQSAFRSLILFFEFCTSCKSTEPDTPSLMPQKNGWTDTSISSMINTFLSKHMAVAMHKEASIYKEWIELLREMVLKLPENMGLRAYRALCSSDVDEDFFHNLIHLQKHRRVKALSRFRCIISNSSFPPAMTNILFVPFIFGMLFDVHDGKEHIRNACIETLTSISGHMEWNMYYSLLDRCFHEMILKPDQKKMLLRLTCSILDQFHFFDSCSSKIFEGSVCHPSSCDVGCSILPISSPSMHGQVEISAMQKCLQETFYPKVQNLLNDESDNVNVSASLAAIKILKLLPDDTMKLQLSSIIHRISNFLKSHIVSVRDEARSALASCLRELGMEYFDFVLSTLCSNLKRGYELHVLGYTLSFILSSLGSQIQGKLDDSLDALLSIVQNDIFGDVAEQKEVEKIASRMKETRKKKSFDSLKLISQSITFKSHALKLLSPVMSMLNVQLTPNLKSKLEAMLHHINAGIENNQSVVQVDLFVFIYNVFEGRLLMEIDAVQDVSVSKRSEKCQWNIDKYFCGRSEIENRAKVQSFHIVTLFALRLLQNNLKNVNFKICDAEVLAMLEPFIKILGSFLESSHEDIIAASLQCISLLSQYPFPALEAESNNLKVAVLDIVEGSVRADTPLVHGCLKLLISLLRGFKVTLSSDQLRMLIQSPLFVDIEHSESPIVLSLLKAIISHKLVVPEIYDLVRRIGEVMVTSQTESVRKKCSKILLKFLLDYQVSQKRLQQHIDFLLINLKFEHSAGRESALEMLHAIIVKFPKSVVEEQSHAFFLRFVMCLVNDEDSTIRSMTGAALKNLFKRMGAQSIHSVLEYSISWYLGEKVQLWSAAAQVLGLLVEVVDKRIQKRLSCILLGLRTKLVSATSALKHTKLNSGDYVNVSFWKEAYYSLVMFEKMLNKFGHLTFDKDLEDIWELVTEFLLHPHMWLRNISGRLVAFYFWKARELVKGGSESVLGTCHLLRPSRMFYIAACFCSQLRAKSIDAAAVEVLRENLAFSLWTVHWLMGQGEKLDAHSFWSALELHDQGRFLKSFQILGSGKLYNIFASLSSGICVTDVEDGIEDVRVYLVSYLLKRIGKAALMTHVVQMKIALCVFKTVALKLGEDGCLHYAQELLLPLYKVCEGNSGKVIPDDAKQLAHETRDAIRDILDIQKFVQVYSQIGRDLKAKRDKRRLHEKVLAVVNPALNEKRKRRVAAKNQANKRRKLMMMKAMRWTR